MLTEERRNVIIKAVDERGFVTVQELMELLGTSESTLRRDLLCLDAQGVLTRIHGGAAKKEKTEFVRTTDVNERHQSHREEKCRIAKVAAQMIHDNDIVYLDAGSTTDCVIDCLKDTQATFVTNASVHAVKLMQKGFKVFVIGGELRRRTEAYIGAYAVEMLKKFNFTVGFFGADGVHPRAGYSTPEENEAIVKSYACSRCKRAYALCDSSKFRKAAFITFAPLSAMTLISDAVPDFLSEEEIIKA
ncbi:MAG: DeoR/GlpR family DNA-binding transcription regulator [Clostridiales bacterium]|nr:DeoR/GlpR family DNA-binding transcription regulator [Clostridiales bacterium]